MWFFRIVVRLQGSKLLHRYHSPRPDNPGRFYLSDPISKGITNEEAYS
jgi:hypothetical protein